MSAKQSINNVLALTSLKTCIWILSIAVWMFGMIERTVSVLTYGHFTLLELSQVLLMAFGLMSLFILKPRISTFSDLSDQGLTS